MLRRLLLRQTLSPSPQLRPVRFAFLFFTCIHKHTRREPRYNDRFDGDSALFPAAFAVNIVSTGVSLYAILLFRLLIHRDISVRCANKSR